MSRGGLHLRASLVLGAAIAVISSISASLVHADDAPETARAVGNEPFWSAQLADGVLTVHRLGQDTLSFPVASPDTLPGNAIRIGTPPGATPEVALVVQNALCHDSMTGLPFPQSAELTLDGLALDGCAGAPRDLLAVGEWRVTQIAGAPVPDTPPITLTFAEDGGLSGTGGCNRIVSGYTLTGEGLSFAPIASTRMACRDPVMTREASVFSALEATRSFDIGPGGGLILLGAEGPLLEAYRTE